MAYCIKSEFETMGRVWLRDALSKSILRQFEKSCALDDKPGARLDPQGAISDLLGLKGAFVGQIRQLDTHVKPVRIVSFNKSAISNWMVPWHQDRVIAVKDRHAVEGFKNWSQKSGIWHCEPPRQILDQMIFVRVHLDDTLAENGAMEIALGSHKAGSVAAGNAAKIATSYPSEICAGKRGDILLLKMLTLHRSRAATHPVSRREIRIDFAPDCLPAPLRWHVD